MRTLLNIYPKVVIGIPIMGIDQILGREIIVQINIRSHPSFYIGRVTVVSRLPIIGNLILRGEIMGIDFREEILLISIEIDLPTLMIN